MNNRHPTSFLFDVVIAGAGPVGLLLACELRLARVSVLVLEQAENPHSPLKKLPFGMRGLTLPTIEAFDRRGLLDSLEAPGRQAKPEGKPRKQAGHFAGIPFDYDRIDPSMWAYRLPSPADSNMAAEMERIETVLADRAQSIGVEIRRGVRVEGYAQSADGVTIQAGDQSFEGRWLVGCDGGRSVVRKLGGFSFVGTDPEFTGYSVQVDLADPEKLKLGRQLTPTGMYFQTQPGHFGMVEFDGGASHRTGPITLAHVQAVLRRISQTDVTLTALHVATSWTDRPPQATEYRRGRVLLAGDAAHIHSPLGGQGLNLGLGDAMNLGWKLAATVRGEAPDGLLDSYFTERHPIGERVLAWSRAQVSIMRPSPHARAMESIIRDLIATRDGATYFADRVWNASMRYDLGDGHALAGRSAPDFEWTDGTRLAALLADGTGLLIDFDHRAPLRSIARRWGDKVKYVRGEVKDRLGMTALLVRPDGIVAWACEGEVNPEDAVEAGSRWFAVHDGG
ncbi:FAD-dependent monooxygenase [Rhizobium leguminosarum]|uniref:FAD-dependent monooxygenase n=1 Tax=Rhizobium leguminosarum TaxID=384 RepID=UPI0010404E8E|nr:FAD-dependent monooxygenase [Rhizobium leguminosarum]TBZ43131.1 FAD-dependent oxidoreductase [Rhizobium leguminosarum bv. viciae]